MPLGMEVGLSPCDFVSDEDPAPPQKGQSGYWTILGYVDSQSANSWTGHLADWSTSGLENSWTSQLTNWTRMDWTTRGCCW